MFGFRRRPDLPRWNELLGDIGRSAVELLGAEVAGAREELSELLRRALAVAVVGTVAAGLAFWALGAAATAAIAGLAVWLPVWGAALVLFGVLAVIALVLALVARSRVRRLEGPGRILRRRLDSHLEFWRDEIFGATGEEGAEEAVRRAVPERSRERLPDGGSRGRPAVSVEPPEDDLTGMEP